VRSGSFMHVLSPLDSLVMITLVGCYELCSLRLCRAVRL